MSTPEHQRGSFFLFALCAVYFAVFCLTLSHYGLTWDSALGEQYLGDKILQFAKTLNPEYLQLAQDNLEIYRLPDQPNYFATAAWGKAHPEHIWPLGPLLAALSREVLHTQSGVLDAIDAQHFYLVFAMLGLFVLVFRFAREHFGASAAAVATLVLALHPRLWADAHNNIKDIPSTFFLTATLFELFRAVALERKESFVTGGLLWGCALAAKGNALFVPAIVCPWILFRGKPDRIVQLYRVILSGAAAVIVMVGLWPLLLQTRSSLPAHLSYLLQYGTAGAPGFHIGPIVEAFVTVPLPFLVLFLVGVLPVCTAAEANRPGFKSAVFLFLWLAVPILRVSLPHANDFDGIRHWEEYLVPFSIIAGVGAQQLFSRLPSTGFAWAVLGVLCLPSVVWMSANHPFEICFYNSLIGGLPGARERNLPQATDYWGSSFRSGIEWLNANAPEGSTIVVPVAPHIVLTEKKIWLREDLHVVTYAGWRAQSDPDALFLTLVRKEHYPSGLDEDLRQATELHVFSVEGEPILQITQLCRRAE
ncbi:MAG: glycosyltransferase family 39 protein [Bdellovibrionota bacterium]